MQVGNYGLFVIENLIGICLHKIGLSNKINIAVLIEKSLKLITLGLCKK